MLTAVQNGHFIWDLRLRQRLPRMLSSLAVMAVVLYGLNMWFAPSYAEGAGFLAAVVALVVMMVAGAASYFIAAHVTGAFRFSDLKSSLRR